MGYSPVKKWSGQIPRERISEILAPDISLQFAVRLKSKCRRVRRAKRAPRRHWAGEGTCLAVRPHRPLLFAVRSPAGWQFSNLSYVSSFTSKCSFAWRYCTVTRCSLLERTFLRFVGIVETNRTRFNSP